MNEPQPIDPNAKKPRPTLAELAASAAQAGGEDPWACPNCGCRDWRVVNSHERNGLRKRQRVCRHCGQPIRTLEIPVPDGYKIKIEPE